MRWAALLSGTLIVCASGCRNCDKVESELRARESDVRELREELDKAEFFNHAMQRELRAVRGEPGPFGHVERPVEAYPVRSIVLGRQTAGHPSDTGTGDDALMVMVEPRDPQSQAIKAPGTLYVEAQEVTPEGLKKPLSAWEVPPQKLAETWSQGLFTTGYLLTLPWKVWPSTEKLRVTARFRLNDGRIFEADKDITVRVSPAHQRRTPAAPPPPAAATHPTAPTPAPAPDPVPPVPKKEAAPLPAPVPVPTPVGPPLEVTTQWRDAAIRLRPAATILRPVPGPEER